MEINFLIIFYVNIGFLECSIDIILFIYSWSKDCYTSFFKKIIMHKKNIIFNDEHNLSYVELIWISK